MCRKLIPPFDASQARPVERGGRSGRCSVPQLFIDGEPIGGFDELAALDQAGRLA